MHSRIFVVRTRQEVESGNYESLYGEDGLYDTIYMADYVSKRSADNFVGDLDRLTDSYPCNILQKKFNVDGEVFASGVINSENIGKFIKSVQEEKQKAIASAIVELQKPEPKLWLVSDIVYPRDEFWFEINSALESIYSFSDTIKRMQKKDSVNEIIITETYDYHS